MSGNHFLLTLTDFQRFVAPNPSYAEEYSGFQFRANWENETVEVTRDAAGNEGRLPYTNDPNNPYLSTAVDDPSEYNNVPLYIDGSKYLAHNIKYENSGNQAPYYTAGGGTGHFFVTFADGERVNISSGNQGWQFAIVRPASGGSEELLISFSQTFMDNLRTQIAEHGQPTGLDMGYNGPDGSSVLNSGQGTLLASTVMNSDSGAPICFGRGTMIITENGAVAIENIKAGDLILTIDNGLQPVRWVGTRKLSRDELSANPGFLPIRIRQNALGAGSPSRDLEISPQHRILISSNIAQRMFGSKEVLVAGKALLELPGIEIVENAGEVEYFHLLFDQHEIIYANGIEAESLYTGREALKSLGSAAREEIFALLPELREGFETEQMPESARLLCGVKKARRLISRHSNNEQPLQKIN